MDNFSNDRLDKFFEEGAKQQVYQYREDAWAAMDDMLEAKSRKRRLLWWFFGSAIVLLLTTGAIYFSSTKVVNNDASNAIAKMEQATDVRISEKENTPSNTPSNTTNNRAINTILSEEKVGDNDSRSDEHASNNSNIAPSKAAIVATNNSINRTTNTATKTVANDDTNSTFNASSKINLNTDHQLIIAFPTETAKNRAKTKGEIPLLLETNLSTSVTIPHTIKTTSELIENYEAMSASTDNKLSKTAYSVGLYAAPEWNSLSGTQTSRRGMRIGVRADAYFAKHFSLGIGMAYSRKFYNSAGSNYHAPMEFFVDGIMPEIIDAKCEVIEIPLEIKYYFKHFQENGFFVGAGVNSYLLRSEWYGFTYEDPNSNSAPEYNGSRENNHFFNIATVTAGYQYRINDRFNMQVSPYFQIPLTGIGFGQVNLKSAGLSVGMNMKLN